MRSAHDQLGGSKLFDSSDGDVLARGHFIAHEILEDDADFPIEIFQVVFPQVHAVEQDLPLGRIVEPRHQLHDRSLAFAILADQSDPLARTEVRFNLSITARVDPG